MHGLVKILELLTKYDGKISDALSSMPQLHRVENQIISPWRVKGRVVRRLIEITAGQKREVVDGVRLLFEDSWVLILPDPGRPLFKIMAEAKNKQKAELLVEEYTEAVKKLQNE